MLVYGDPQFKVQIKCMRNHLQSLLRNPKQGEGSLDFWRELLIRTGQLEQGIADLSPELIDPAVVRNVELLTERVAERFYAAWADKGGAHAEKDEEDSLQFLEGLDDLNLNIKVPEGYEFYALFPEQYVVSALAWANHHTEAVLKEVLVVGIRSIGTSLSAVVAAALGSVGWKVRRVTVRPKGHPFQRELTMEVREPGNAASAVIVDEGPGISGSSMAAVAEALVNSGFSKANIAFFPGHGNEPGHAASEKIREWWRTVPRFFTPLESLNWSRKTLKELLVLRSERFLAEVAKEPTQEITLQDVTGGGWLPLVYPEGKDWPPVFWPFERLKFRCVGANGMAVLWKFTGLGALGERPVAADADGWKQRDGKHPQNSACKTLPARATIQGFTCTEWINGTALKPEHGEPQVFAAIAEYLVQSASEPLTEEETGEAVKRLCSMLVCNSKEQFGDNAAGKAARLAGLVSHASIRLQLAAMPTCNDGRMAPQEWLRTTAGAGDLFKTDNTANLVDHTLVGRQPLLWDIAGVITEWRLSPEQNEHFQEMLKEQGLDWPNECLAFYLAAYSAFKMGQSVMCLQMGAPDPGYTQRMQQAVDYYSSKLKAILLP